MSLPANREPAECWLCVRMAGPNGIGDGKDPKFLCVECAIMAKDIKAARNDINAYERQALSEAIDKGGEYLVSIDKTDIANLEESELAVFAEKIVRGFGNSLRSQIRERRAPF